jgi:hypothetical protein
MITVLWIVFGLVYAANLGGIGVIVRRGHLFIRRYGD